MKLIYLDTSHISLLTEVLRENPQQFKDILEKWKERNYVLTVSKTHVVEIFGNSFVTVENRFHFLAEMLPLRYESENFFAREILLVLFRKGLIYISEEDRTTNLKLFSTSIIDKPSLDLIKVTHRLINGMGCYKFISLGNFFAWKAKKGDKAYKPPKPKLKDVENTFLFKFFSKFIELDSSNPKIMRRTFEYALNEFNFTTLLNSTLSNEFGTISEKERLRIYDNISLSDCPGLWLKQQVELALKKSGDFDVSNEYDLEHVQYFPYVDIFFADKRIADKIEQILRGPDLIDRLKGASPPIKTSNSLDSLENALFNS